MTITSALIHEGRRANGRATLARSTAIAILQANGVPPQQDQYPAKRRVLLIDDTSSCSPRADQQSHPLRRALGAQAIPHIGHQQTLKNAGLLPHLGDPSIEREALCAKAEKPRSPNRQLLASLRVAPKALAGFVGRQLLKFSAR